MSVASWSPPERLSGLPAGTTVLSHKNLRHPHASHMGDWNLVQPIPHPPRKAEPLLPTSPPHTHAQSHTVREKHAN